MFNLAEGLSKTSKFLTLIRVLGGYKIYEKYLEEQIRKGAKPNHIGIILDGNRRWANTNSYSRIFGHWMGGENVENVLDWSHELDINIVTLYVLSTENLQRSEKELQELFTIIDDKLNYLLTDNRIHKNKIKVKFLGRLKMLPEQTRELGEKLEEATKDYDKQYLNIAIAYGGRMEILDGVREISKKVRDGLLEPDEIDLNTVESHLYTAHLKNPDPDIIIRTSGEERLSGFLLWQGAYSELIFLDVYWPDFRKIDMMRAIRTYQNRTRRFGR